MNKSNYSPLNFIYSAFKFGVSLMAVGSGLATKTAGARPLGNNLTSPNSYHFDPTVHDFRSPLPPTYTSNPIDRKKCRSAIEAIQKGSAKNHQRKHVMLQEHTSITNVTTDLETMGQALRERRINHLSAQDRTQQKKVFNNAKIMYETLSCGSIYAEARKILEQKGLNYKNNPAEYKKALALATVKLIKERHVSINGVSLVIQDGQDGKDDDAICMITDGRFKGKPSRVVLILDKETCDAKGMHPMIKEIRCADLCDEVVRLEKKYKNPKGSGSISLGGGNVGGP